MRNHRKLNIDFFRIQKHMFVGFLYFLPEWFFFEFWDTVIKKPKFVVAIFIYASDRCCCTLGPILEKYQKDSGTMPNTNWPSTY